MADTFIDVLEALSERAGFPTCNMRVGLKRSQNQVGNQANRQAGRLVANDGCKRIVPIWAFLMSNSRLLKIVELGLNRIDIASNVGIDIRNPLMEPI
jgi:hypothetical protein